MEDEVKNLRGLLAAQENRNVEIEKAILKVHSFIWNYLIIISKERS